jgi:predicted nucleic acid-binding protein
MRRILIDSGMLLSYYQQQEPLHQAVVAFFNQNAAQLITSPICIADVLWLLGNPAIAAFLRSRTTCLGPSAAEVLKRSTCFPRITPGSLNSTSATPIYPVIAPISPW